MGHGGSSSGTRVPQSPRHARDSDVESGRKERMEASVRAWRGDAPSGLRAGRPRARGLCGRREIVMFVAVPRRMRDLSGSSSVGRALAFQAKGRGVECRLPLLRIRPAPVPLTRRRGRCVVPLRSLSCCPVPGAGCPASAHRLPRVGLAQARRTVRMRLAWKRRTTVSSPECILSLDDTNK